MPQFYVENFGCRATQADGAAIERQFEQQGLNRAGSTTSADWVVLNTCAVTAAAEQDARAAIRRIRRHNPGCKIVITGCYAQRAPHEIAALDGVWRVIGNSHKSNLAEITLKEQSRNDIQGLVAFVPVENLADSNRATCNPDPVEIYVSDIFAHTELLAAPVFDSANGRTRPNLKVQDGCNNRCSFCIIPSVRGRSRSMPLDEVVLSVNRLVEDGYKEVVISGINLGRWGSELARGPALPPARSSEARRAMETNDRLHDLEHLIQAVLNQTALEKLRISSVEPMDWGDSLIRLMAESSRIAKHAHVPMQSGSDSVLRRMHRKYRPWHYREKIEKIRSAMPTAAIGADVMVGFPGESEAEFEETRRMIEDLPFTYLHVFTFSARPGTPAASMPNQVPVQVARERNRVLRELASNKKLAFMQAFIGREVEAITLNAVSESEEGPWTQTLTDNYLKLKLQATHPKNEWLNAKVTAVRSGELIGTIAV